MKVKINGKWHSLKVGEFVLFDHITKTVKIATVSFTPCIPQGSGYTQ